MWKNDDFHPFHYFPFIPWPAAEDHQLVRWHEIRSKIAQLPSDEFTGRETGGREEPSLISPINDHLSHVENSVKIELGKDFIGDTFQTDYKPLVIGCSEGRQADERFMNAGLDNGGEFVSHTKTRLVDHSACNELNITEKETADKVRVIPNGSSSNPHSLPFHVNPARFCAPPPCVHEVRNPYSQASSPRPSTHRESCHGSSQCPTRSPCSSPATSLGDEISSVPTNPLWTSFRDRYIDEHDESRASDASQSLLREIRRLRRMNDEAMSLLTALQTTGVTTENRPPTTCTFPKTHQHPRYLSFKEGRQSVSQEQCWEKAGEFGLGGSISMNPEFESLVSRLTDNVTSDLNAQIRSQVVTGIVDFLRQNPQLMQQIKKPETTAAVGSTENNPLL